MFNRAAYGTFPAGSTFKIIVALAGLESGILNPSDVYESKGYYQLGGRGRPIRDTAGEGKFDFERAFYKSSNPYFIHYGLQIGAERLIEMGRRFRFGEPTGLLTRQEARGYFPLLGPPRKQDGSRWMDGDTANLSIGHGEILVTPLQMAVMVAAIANGGAILQPRLVDRIEPQANVSAENSVQFPASIVRSEIRVSQRTLDTLRKGMLADVENPEGTGRRAAVSDHFKVCGKTGTAALPKESITWFVSYAPYENPRYAVAVVVSSGPHEGSGGGTCAPVAREIYQTIVKREAAAQKAPSLVNLQ